MTFAWLVDVKRFTKPTKLFIRFYHFSSSADAVCSVVEEPLMCTFRGCLTYRTMRISHPCWFLMLTNHEKLSSVVHLVFMSCPWQSLLSVSSCGTNNEETIRFSFEGHFYYYYYYYYYYFYCKKQFWCPSVKERTDNYGEFKCSKLYCIESVY